MVGWGGRGSVGEAGKKRAKSRNLKVAGGGKYEKLHNIARRSMINKKRGVDKFRFPSPLPSLGHVFSVEFTYLSLQKQSICGYIVTI